MECWGAREYKAGNYGLDMKTILKLFKCRKTESAITKIITILDS